MNWSYRVIRQENDETDRTASVSFAIHEVYTGDSGIPQSCSRDPAELRAESPEALRAKLKAMLEAAHEPVLEYRDVGP